MKIINNQLRTDLPQIKSGDTVIVYQKIKEGDKERIQPFEGLVLARKHGKGINAAITVRRVVRGIGVEKIYPIHSPTIDKIEVLRHSKVRRAKLYYIRKKAAKEARKKLRQVGARPEVSKPVEESPQETEQLVES